ncbi:MAG TPA: hypothetical protein VGM51_01040 [Armatimonadota bacterium]|jgi:hypothetical protein
MMQLSRRAVFPMAVISCVLATIVEPAQSQQNGPLDAVSREVSFYNPAPIVGQPLPKDAVSREVAVGREAPATAAPTPLEAVSREVTMGKPAPEAVSPVPLDAVGREFTMRLPVYTFSEAIQALSIAGGLEIPSPSAPYRLDFQWVDRSANGIELTDAVRVIRYVVGVDT